MLPGPDTDSPAGKVSRHDFAAWADRKIRMPWWRISFPSMADRNASVCSPCRM